jgi:hypothetical protein
MAITRGQLTDLARRSKFIKPVRVSVSIFGSNSESSAATASTTFENEGKYYDRSSIVCHYEYDIDLKPTTTFQTTELLTPLVVHVK